jgi:hypothetical protein
VSLFHELVLFRESKTVNAEKSPSENAIGDDTLCLILSLGISNWDDDEYTYLYKYEKSEKGEKMLNTWLNAQGGSIPRRCGFP